MEEQSDLLEGSMSYDILSVYDGGWVVKVLSLKMP